jgi:hypothetical protein
VTAKCVHGGVFSLRLENKFGSIELSANIADKSDLCKVMQERGDEMTRNGRQGGALKQQDESELRLYFIKSS